MTSYGPVPGVAVKFLTDGRVTVFPTEVRERMMVREISASHFRRQSAERTADGLDDPLKPPPNGIDDEQYDAADYDGLRDTGRDRRLRR
jgi:hypothetical protein